MRKRDEEEFVLNQHLSIYHNHEGCRVGVTRCQPVPSPVADRRFFCAGRLKTCKKNLSSHAAWGRFYEGEAAAVLENAPVRKIVH